MNHQQFLHDLLANISLTHKEGRPMSVVDQYLNGSSSYIKKDFYPVVANFVCLRNDRWEDTIRDRDYAKQFKLHKGKLESLIIQLWNEQKAIKEGYEQLFSKTTIQDEALKLIGEANITGAIELIGTYLESNYSSFEPEVKKIKERSVYFDLKDESKEDFEAFIGERSRLAEKVLFLPSQIIQEQSFLYELYWEKRQGAIPQIKDILEKVSLGRIKEALSLTEGLQDPKKKGIVKFHWIQHEFRRLSRKMRMGTSRIEYEFEKRHELVTAFVDFILFDLTPPQSE